MAYPLMRRLGPRSALRVVNALGSLKEGASNLSDERPQMGRRAFWRFGAGMSVATALVLAGKTPALAADSQRSALAWVNANRSRLPQTYADVVSHPMAYRRAILQASTPPVRSQLWVEHVRRYRETHLDLTRQQHRVIDSALEVFHDESLFRDSLSAAHEQQLRELKDAAIEAFGKLEARALIATLGTEESTTSSAAYCDCSQSSDWCWFGDCSNLACFTYPTPGGCGTAGVYPCNGLCA
ncbi:bacteriocin fulvocin C-related protein [Streptomyces sp. NPDC050388]|uniref:bacteriocin fulvocin C-related protein n=1 Tax=Streptomyces sp. NPDC050388 TaxID=3155781 RepID=UPI00342B0D6C